MLGNVIFYPGKIYYFEIKIKNIKGGYIFIGVALRDIDLEINSKIWKSKDIWSLELKPSGGYTWHNNTNNKYSSHKFKKNDIIGIEMDMIDGELKYWINGVFSGTAYIENDFKIKPFSAIFGIGNKT